MRGSVRLLWAFLFGFPLLAANVAVAPQALTFAYQFNSRIPPPDQGIVLTSPERFTFTVSRPPGDSWLLLQTGTNTYSDNGPIFVQVGVNPSALGPGTYTSALTVKTTQGAVVVPVTFVVSTTPVLLACLYSTSDSCIGLLGFDQSATLLQVGIGLSNGANFVATPKSDRSWLNVIGATSQLTVSTNPAVAGAGLSAGSIQVSVISFAGAPANNPLTLPVINMGAGFSSAAPLTPNPAALAFTGSGTQTVPVVGPVFTATADAKWLKTVVSGQSLTVTADATGMDSGTYSATVTLNAGGVLQAFPVSLTLGPPTLTKVVNAASWVESPVAPGEVVVLGGSNLGPNSLTGLTLDANGFVSSTLAGVQVTFNGIAAPLVYVNATQLAAVAPYELDGKASAAVQVSVNGRTSNTLTVPVGALAPGIFTANASGTGPASAFRSGDTVSIYVTGEGQTAPNGINGKVTTTPPVPLLPVTATLDGQPVEVSFAGEAPGIVSGVMQVNLKIPVGARTGELPLVVSVGNTATQSGVTISVR